MQDDRLGNQRELVPIFASVLHTLERTVAGRTYTLSVWLPPQYDETSAAYPVVYLLDANTLFGMASSTAFALGLYHEIPDVIVVGIGVPMRHYDDWAAHRGRDFTPTVDPDNPDPTGEAPRFLQVLQTDVIPFIDTHYRTTPHDRTLFGYSLAGLFVAYAYLQAPGLFHRLVAGSPNLDFDHRLAFTICPYEDVPRRARRVPRACRDEESGV
jgi:predicted alpha/beta superfamily hydrolase